MDYSIKTNLDIVNGSTNKIANNLIKNVDSFQNNFTDYTDKFINKETLSDDIHIPIQYGTMMPALYDEVNKKITLTTDEKVIFLKGQEVVFKKGKSGKVWRAGCPAKHFSEILVVTNYSKLCYVSIFWDVDINTRQIVSKQIVPAIYFNEDVKLNERLISIIQIFDDITFRNDKNPWLYDQNLIKSCTVLLDLATHIQKIFILNKENF